MGRKGQLSSRTVAVRAKMKVTCGRVQPKSDLLTVLHRKHLNRYRSRVLQLVPRVTIFICLINRPTFAIPVLVIMCHR